MNKRERWHDGLAAASTEEDVKAAYAAALNLTYNTSDRHDLYTDHVLFEFKFDKHLSGTLPRARVLAQLLYYVRALKYGDVKKRIPEFLVMADRNECGITQSRTWDRYVKRDTYDWDLTPSSPDQALINDLASDPAINDIRIFSLDSRSQADILYEELRNALSNKDNISPVKKVITEDNFITVFDYWKELFGTSVENGIKASTYFISDIQSGKSHLIADQGKVIFEINDQQSRQKKILTSDYEFFWSLYDKVTSADIIQAIVAKIDRINDMQTRRFEGEFYTPLPFAKKGIEYLEKTFGKNWHKKQIRIWDMAAGTGNLEWYLPNQMTLELYASTLHDDEVSHCQRIFLGATCFQYDYLNDDIERVLEPNKMSYEHEWKMPEKLRRELADPDIEWVVLINPPFGTAQTAGANSLSKARVSSTKVQPYMHEDGLGEVSRELFQQFLYRIGKELPADRTHLALYSTLKFMNSTNDRKFRDASFQYRFERGFIFEAKNFHGTKGKFPVGMTIWDMSRPKHLESQRLLLDVFDRDVRKIGTKVIETVSKDKFLSSWIDRPRGVSVFPPFKSAINIATDNKDTRDRISADFIGSLDNAGNDVQNSNRVGLYSGPFATAGAHSITPDIFEESMVIHAVRRIIPNTWINDRDQFLQPNQELSAEFVSDCVVWGLFAHSNQTSALKDVNYKDAVYQVENHFYPFLLSDVAAWKPTDTDIALGALHAHDRYAAEWLIRRTLSSDASALLASAREVYRLFYENLTVLRTPKFKISTWDAGWWQIRNALVDQATATDELQDVANARRKLQEKLLKEIYRYGFITSEIDVTVANKEELL